jgi:hypothetical protein
LALSRRSRASTPCKTLQDLRRGYLGNRPFAERLAGEPHEPFGLVDGRRRLPLVPLFGDELVGDDLERVGLLVGLRDARELLLLARVEADTQLPLGLLPARAGVLQRDGRIGTDRELPLLADVAIGEIPEFSAGWRDPKLKAAAVRQLRDAPLGGAESLNLLVRERHGVGLCWSLLAPRPTRRPTKPLAVNGHRQTILDVKLTNAVETK